MKFQRKQSRNFPGSPVVKTCIPNAEGTGFISGWGTKIRTAQTKKGNKAMCLTH